MQSAIVRIAVDPERRAAVPDLRVLSPVHQGDLPAPPQVPAGELVAALKGVLDKPDVDEILAEMELADDARTEQLDVPTLLRLTELVRRGRPSGRCRERSSAEPSSAVSRRSAGVSASADRYGDCCLGTRSVNVVAEPEEPVP